jgi:alpha-L-fucosidase
VTQPDQAYTDKFYNRTVDLINKYKPDLLYFDDTALPLWPASDAGLKIAAHFYNHNNHLHGSREGGVLLGKILDPEQRQCMVWDIERGSSNVIEPEPWQTDTCIGAWHYDKGVFDGHRYKSAKTVVQTLIDVVSKNGNLLLSVPLKGDGSLDADEIAIIEGIADWMEVNKEAIHGTRPWKVLGEGPQMASAAPLQAQGFNEGKGRKLGSDDLRFTAKGDTIYAFVMGSPTAAVTMKSLGSNAKLLDRPIATISLLGSSETLKWSQTDDALVIEKPQGRTSDTATVFKISLKH